MASSGSYKGLTHLEQNPSNSAYAEGAQGGFFLMKKPLEGDGFGYVYSESALAREPSERGERLLRFTAILASRL